MASARQQATWALLFDDFPFQLPADTLAATWLEQHDDADAELHEAGKARRT